MVRAWRPARSICPLVRGRVAVGGPISPSLYDEHFNRKLKPEMAALEFGIGAS